MNQPGVRIVNNQVYTQRTIVTTTDGLVECNKAAKDKYDNNKGMHQAARILTMLGVAAFAVSVLPILYRGYYYRRKIVHSANTEEATGYAMLAIGIGVALTVLVTIFTGASVAKKDDKDASVDYKQEQLALLIPTIFVAIFGGVAAAQTDIELGNFKSWVAPDPIKRTAIPLVFVVVVLGLLIKSMMVAEATTMESKVGCDPEPHRETVWVPRRNPISGIGVGSRPPPA